jgi:microcystin-dependent protein
MKPLLLVGLLAFLTLGVASAQSAVPPLVNYRGLLMDENGAAIPDGVKQLEFSLYDAPLAGNLVWGPQVFDRVSVVNGHFNVILGPTDQGNRSITSGFSAKDRFLTIRVSNGSGSVEISPRQQVLSAPFSLNAGNGMPTGAIIPYAGSQAPIGFLLFNGQAVNRSTYAELFAAIGTIYGAGDGTASFNVPNLQGRFIVGLNPSDPSLSNLAGTGGEAKHTLSANEMPVHAHGDITDWEVNEAPWANESSGNPGDRLAVANAGRRSGQRLYSQFTTNNAGGGEPHNNIPPYITLNWLIKF